MAYTYGDITNATVVGHGTRSDYQVRFGYQLNSQDSVNNKSNISLKLVCRSTNSSYATYGAKQTATIDGTALTAASFDMRETNAWQNFGIRTFDVSHDANGNYSATKQGSFTTNATNDWALKSGSASVTFTLPQIQRYAEFTAQPSISNIKEHTSHVEYTADRTLSNAEYAIRDNTGASINIFDGQMRQGNQNNTTAVSRIFSNKSNLYITQGTPISFSTNLDLNTFDYCIYVAQKPFLESNNTMLYVSGYTSDANFTFTSAYDGYLGFTVRRKNETNIVPSDVSAYWFQLEMSTIVHPYEAYNNPGVYSEWVPITNAASTFDLSNLSADTSYTIKVRIQANSNGLWRESNEIYFSTLPNVINIKVNNEWKKAISYVKINGEWKLAIPHIKVNNNWEEGIN